MPKPILTNLGELLVNILGIDFFQDKPKKGKPNPGKDQAVSADFSK